MASAAGVTGLAGALAVHQDRIARLQAGMGRQRIDVMLIGPSSDFYYLTGHDAHLSERMTMLIVPQSGPASAVVPVLEAPLALARRELFDVSAWTETESPAERAASLLELRDGGRETTIAVGDQLWSVFLHRLQTALPNATWVSATLTMRSLRMHKDERERLRKVSRRTDAAWDEFIANDRIAGLTEQQAMALVRDRMAARGPKIHGGICASGPNSASPHHHTGERVIQPGDAVIFDWGGTLEGYHSDVTRSVRIGPAPDEFRLVYDTVRHANRAAYEASGQAWPARTSTARPETSSPRPGMVTRSSTGSVTASSWPSTRSRTWSAARTCHWRWVWSSAMSPASTSKAGSAPESRTRSSASNTAATGSTTRGVS